MPPPRTALPRVPSALLFLISNLCLPQYSSNPSLPLHNSAVRTIEVIWQTVILFAVIADLFRIHVDSNQSRRHVVDINIESAIDFGIIHFNTVSLAHVIVMRRPVPMTPPITVFPIGISLLCVNKSSLSEVGAWPGHRQFNSSLCCCRFVLSCWE